MDSQRRTTEQIVEELHAWAAKIERAWIVVVHDDGLWLVSSRPDVDQLEELRAMIGRSGQPIGFGGWHADENGFRAYSQLLPEYRDVEWASEWMRFFDESLREAAGKVCGVILRPIRPSTN